MGTAALSPARVAAAAALAAACAAGVALLVRDDRLFVRAPRGCPPSVLAGLRQHEAAVLDLLEAWCERCSIQEHDGGMPRAEAERRAWARTVGLA